MTAGKKKKERKLYRISPGDYPQAPKEKSDWVRIKVKE